MLGLRGRREQRGGFSLINEIVALQQTKQRAHRSLNWVIEVITHSQAVVFSLFPHIQHLAGASQPGTGSVCPDCFHVWGWRVPLPWDLVGIGIKQTNRKHMQQNEQLWLQERHQGRWRGMEKRRRRRRKAVGTADLLCTNDRNSLLNIFLKL